MAVEFYIAKIVTARAANAALSLVESPRDRDETATGLSETDDYFYRVDTHTHTHMVRGRDVGTEPSSSRLTACHAPEAPTSKPGYPPSLLFAYSFQNGLFTAVLLLIPTGSSR